MKASMPVDTIGHATIEGRPQFSPAMIESCGPGTRRSRRASIEASMHAARVVSTLRMAG
jgi:hypothetical protein